MKAYLWKTFAKDNRIRGTKNEEGEAAYLLGKASPPSNVTLGDNPFHG